VFDEEQLRELGRAERLRLIRALVALESPGSRRGRVVRRRRAVALAAIIVCCVILAGWIGALAVTLPRYYRPGGWRGRGTGSTWRS
jgi:ferric-dicitrate binding protein FerR (iron transport regulator)